MKTFKSFIKNAYSISEKSEPISLDKNRGQKYSRDKMTHEKPKVNESLTVAYGRFNPPTIGHEKLFTLAEQVAGEEGEYKIYPSHTQDKKINPLDSKTKVEFMKKMFPSHAENIVYDTSIRTIFDILKEAHELGYRKVNIVAGDDRVSEYSNLTQKYNGKLYSFEQINIINAGKRDSNSKGVEGISSSKLREAVLNNDFKAFSSGISKNLKTRDVKKLYVEVCNQMGVDANIKYNLWEIAPKFDWNGLRENFVNGKIFQVGSLVENLNTGFIGKIIRRGTNYIICVTREGYLFKSWIKDLNEVYEVGTDSYREYVQRMTPREKIQSFINKSTKKRKIKRK